MRLGAQAGLLCVLGVAAGLAANLLSPHPAPLGDSIYAAADHPGASCREPSSTIPRITFSEAAPLCAACTAVFVDARTPAEYAAGHVTGALHLAPGEDPASLLPRLRGPVIVYDGDAGCALADQVAKRLHERGVADVRVLSGAWPAWLAGGGPGASGACETCGGRP